jgi:hypothetical protein
VETLEELREPMAISKPPGSPDLWIAEEVTGTGAEEVEEDQAQLG